MTLGEYIKDFREKNGLSQRDFAKSSGLSAGYISMLENNRNPKTGEPLVPKIDTYRAVAKATGRTPNEILDLMDDDVPVDLSPGENLDGQIMSLVRLLPDEQKLTLLDLLHNLVRGVKKK